MRHMPLQGTARRRCPRDAILSAAPVRCRGTTSLLFLSLLFLLMDPGSCLARTSADSGTPLRLFVPLTILSKVWAMDVDLLPFFPGPGIEKGDQDRDTAGRTGYKMVYNGVDRVYETYKPAVGKPKGLLVCIHGWLETSSFACDYYCQPYADQYNYIATCPHGMRRPTNWCTAPSTACKRAGTIGWNTHEHREWWADEDVGYISAVVDRVQEEEVIPKNRTFAIGFSFGGAMVFRLSCELSHKFDGFAVAGMSWHPPQGPLLSEVLRKVSGVGAEWRGPNGDCGDNPTHPKPMWSGSGTADIWFPRSNVWAGWVQYSTKVLGCSGEPQKMWTSKEGHVECYQFPRCSGAPTRHCIYDGMDHAFPGGDDDIQPVGDELPAVPASWAFWLSEMGVASSSYDDLHKVRQSALPSPEPKAAEAGAVRSSSRHGGAAHTMAYAATTGATVGGIVACVAVGVSMRPRQKQKRVFEVSITRSRVGAFTRSKTATPAIHL